VRDVDSAVKSARRAYKNVWSKMPGRERGKFLYRIARLLRLPNAAARSSAMIWSTAGLGERGARVPRSTRSLTVRALI